MEFIAVPNSVNRVVACLTQIFILPVALAFQGEIRLYVDRAAPPNGDGLTWQTAFNDLQKAFDVAKTRDGEDDVTIRIARGIYRPDRGTGDRNTAFDLTLDATQVLYWNIIGSCAGLQGPDPDEYDPVQHPTILSGDLGGDDLPDQANRDDNSDCILRATTIGGRFRFRGLLITGGQFNGYSGAGRAPVSFENGLSVDISELRFEDCRFIDNHSEAGPGAIYSDADVLVLQESEVSGNSGLTGALEHRPEHGFFSVSGCRVANNRGIHFGAVYSSAFEIELNSSVISRNTSLFWGGGLRLEGYQNRVLGCLFVGNEAGSTGGAIDVRGDFWPFIRVDSCTFSGNAATYGGAMYSMADLRMYNTIMWGNTGHRAGDAIAMGNPDADAFVVNSLIQGGADAIYGFMSSLFWGSYLDEDPRFVDPGAGDYRLSLDSPCIDAGAHSDYELKYDLLDLPRVVAIRPYSYYPIDVGCYEYQCPADTNHDGFVNGVDFDRFMEAFQAGNLLADVDQNGFVNGADFDLFVAAFDAGC